MRKRHNLKNKRKRELNPEEYRASEVERQKTKRSRKEGILSAGNKIGRQQKLGVEFAEKEITLRPGITHRAKGRQVQRGRSVEKAPISLALREGGTSS